jgi:hypothetical protein
MISMICRSSYLRPDSEAKQETRAESRQAPTGLLIILDIDVRATPNSKPLQDAGSPPTETALSS